MRTSFLVLLLVASTACSSISTEFGGQSVSQRGGHLYVDDVSLDFHREMGLSGTLDGAQFLSITSATGSISLTGVPGSGYDLVIELYTEFEDDGEVLIDADGHLRARSQRDGRALIESVRGTVPAGVALRLATGTGRISATGLVGRSSLEAETGTGAVAVSHCDVESISIDTGTGALTLEDCRIDEFRIRSGAGDVIASDSHIGHLIGSVGTSDVRLRSSVVDELKLTSATGDLLLLDSSVGQATLSLGTGTVVTKSAPATP